MQRLRMARWVRRRARRKIRPTPPGGTRRLKSWARFDVSATPPTSLTSRVRIDPDPVDRNKIFSGCGARRLARNLACRAWNHLDWQARQIRTRLRELSGDKDADGVQPSGGGP